MIEEFTFFFYKYYKFKIIYSKFHCDSLISYKDIEQK